MAHSSHRYQDKWLWLLVPFFGVLYRHTGETASLKDLLSTPIYYLDVATAILVIGIIFTVTRATIVHLDRRVAWEDQTALRGFIQGFVVYGFTVLLTVLVSFFYNEFFMTRPPEFNVAIVFAYDVPFACLMVTIIQMAYGLLYMRAHYEAKLEQKAGAQETNTVSRKTILANFGKAKVPLPASTIAYVHKVGDFSTLQTFEGKEYTLDDTLDQLEQWLEKTDFFRINRQCIAQRRAIVSMKNDPTGKVLLKLSPSPPEEITVSRKKAQEFRSWMQQ
ncbi:MAG: LytTR family DNA-binding domain-containing protein [Imperialibacter sp.]|uniref:LytR/AlgR family response regulator transcription factor n=1 Tax=Imperialibacter sp. TaxID=2038411 RepID=UPI0032F07C13